MAPRSPRPSPALALAALLAASCVTPATALVLRVESDLVPVAQLVSVRVRVQRDGETTQRYDHTFVVGSQFALPGDVSLTPATVDDARRLHVVVDAALADGGSLTREYRVSFTAQQTRLLEVFLAARCEVPSTPCAAGTTCGRTTCESIDDPRVTAFTPAGAATDAGADGGPVSRCPPDMVLIAGGSFLMGTDPPDGDDDEHPSHLVELSDFCIERTEVTVLKYRQCTTCEAPLPGMSGFCNWDLTGRDQHPINCVTWYQADAYCRAVGRSLPTEAQWEYAARGVDGRTYPWGEAEPTTQGCWNIQGQRAGTCPVGSIAAGDTPEGVHDLGGNVSEWVSDWFDRYTASDIPPVDPTGPGDTLRKVLRGGGWNGYITDDFRGARRWYDLPNQRGFGLGMRCVSAPR